MRVGELCNLSADPVVEIGDHHSLQVPVGKLRNDRYDPLHSTLVDLIADWQTNNAVHIARTGRLLTDDISTVDRHRVALMGRRIAKNAGIGWVQPHQLRHTLATQAINRGMRLESVAALLGHKNVEMTMVYARIADATVADATVAEEYFDVTNQVDQPGDPRRESPLGDHVDVPLQEVPKVDRQATGVHHRGSWRTGRWTLEPTKPAAND